MREIKHLSIEIAFAALLSNTFAAGAGKVLMSMPAR